MSVKERLKPCAARNRYVLVTVNLFFLVTGICMISFATYLKITTFQYYDVTTTYEHYFDTRFFSVVNTLYIVGILMSTISLLGFVGAFTENIFILLLFSVCLATVFILEVGFAATAYLMREQIKESLTKSMYIMMHDYGTNAGSQRTVDNIQELLGCCGVSGCEDWEGNLPVFISFISERFRRQEQPYISFEECRITTIDNGSFRVRAPESCCGMQDNYYHCVGISKRGCISQLGFLMNYHYIRIAGLVVGIVAIQITGIILACLLAQALYIQKIKRGMKYSLLQEELVKSDYY